jgi:outer membrane receptor protein involved in Fe transport
MREMTVTSLGYRNVTAPQDGTTNSLTPDESFAWTPAAWGGLGEEYYWNILGKSQEEVRNRFISSIAPQWNIIEGLSLKGRMSTDLSADKIENKENTERPLALGDPTGSYRLRNDRYEIYYGDLMLSFDRKFAQNFGLIANVGYQGRAEQQFYANSNTSSGLTVENWFNINASRNKADASTYKMQLLKTAYFGTLGVSYGDFAYLEGTARQEKTSTLAPGNNSFFYPSVNASVIYTEALRSMLPSWYNYGKLRASYAVVGNAPDVYLANQAFNQKSMSGFTYNTTMDAVGNDGLKPETKYEWEVGLENKFFGNRLGFEVSFYTNTVKDQILPTTTTITQGGSSILLNIGELENTGLEIVLNGTPYRGNGVEVNLNANIAFQRNKVVKLQEGFDRLTHATWDGAAELRSYVGQPMGDIYAYVPYRDPETGKKVVDESTGLYMIDHSEMKKVANAMPKALGGFGGSVSWKGLTLDFTFDYRIGGAVLNTPYEYLMGRGNLVESMPYRDAEHGGMTYYFEGNNNGSGSRIAWSGAQGPNGERVYDNGLILDAMKGKIVDGNLVVTGRNDIIAPADRYYNWTFNWGADDPTTYEEAIFDNTYLKCREITLSYQLPKSITQKFACKGLTLSAFGRNLFYIYKNLPAFDAEATDGTSWMSQANIGGSTATARSFGFSLRMSF